MRLEGIDLQLQLRVGSPARVRAGSQPLQVVLRFRHAGGGMLQFILGMSKGRLSTYSGGPPF